MRSRFVNDVQNEMTLWCKPITLRVEPINEINVSTQHTFLLSGIGC